VPGKQGDRAFLAKFVDGMLARTTEPMATFVPGLAAFLRNTFRRFQGVPQAQAYVNRRLAKQQDQDDDDEDDDE
jgi:hypothetical protein